jgi:SAM-dependent methyltransferase
MHKGKVVAEKEEYKVIDCRSCGFKHLYPIPTEDEMNKYYSKKYYSEGKKKGRSAMRLVTEGEKRDTHLRWLKNTLYKDNLYFFEKYTKTTTEPNRILDIGCGTGDFLKYMKNAGWETFGLEPSITAFKKAKALGLNNIYNMTLEEFLERNSELIKYFDVVSLIGVLHHMPNPIETLEISSRFLKPGGIMCLLDPNEFTSLQITAKKKLDKEMWWVFPPEHINYFDFQAYEKLIKRVGLEPIMKMSAFPMEMFLLMDEDYVGNNVIGDKCHKKRISFDLSIPDQVRRSLYHSLAEVGIGRDCIIYSKLQDEVN